jgi:hypothetical protein
MAEAPGSIVVSFTVAVWLTAKGFTPLDVVYNPQRGRVEFLFSAEARNDWAAYYVAKNRLETMMKQAGAR